ncbi:hypothetical protein EV648_105368 [Kribbella sp. VKM Ac-2568]|nr:hypothetical protein EV648_105368 [Kribbella sp. VKM Ac-2568]
MTEPRTVQRVTSASLSRPGSVPPFIRFAVKGIKLPVAVSVFPNEIYQAPRSWAVKAYPKLLRYSKLPVGGHFAAWEQPKLFSEELRASFRSLR